MNQVLREEKFNNKIDVYAFAIVLWEMLTCQLPWYLDHCFTSLLPCSLDYSLLLY
jgi:serine/threonine protein kinase